MSWVASLIWLVAVLGGVDNIVNNPGQFVGRVRCVDPLVCTADVTQFGGQTFTGGSYLELRGAYNYSTPASITNGFRLAEAYFSPGCSPTTMGCGDEHDAFMGSLEALATTYNPNAGVRGKPRVVYAGAEYLIDQKPMRWLNPGLTLDMSAGPIFRSKTSWASSIVPIPGTITINVATNDHLATITGGNLCPGATCYDGTAILNPGDRVRLVGTGNWTGTNPAIVVTVIGMTLGGTGFEFIPRLTSNYTGTAEIGTAKMMVFDWRTHSKPGQYPQLYGSTEIIGGQNAQVICDKFCFSVNAALGRTTAFFREAPMQEVVQYGTYSMRNTLSLGSVCGRNDSTLTIGDSSGILGQGGNGSGNFEGFLAGCEPKDAMEQLHGDDPNSDSRRGGGALVTVLAPAFKYDASGLTFGAGRVFLVGGNSGRLDVNSHTFEGVMQMAWLPEGGQDISFHGLSPEQAPGGYGDCATVESQPNRPAFFDFDELRGNPTDITGYSISFERMFMGCRTAPFVRINSPTYSARLKLNGAIQNTSKLLDITGSKVSVVGNVECDLGTFAKPGACDRPAQGHFIGLMVTNLDGTLNWKDDVTP